MNEELLSFIEFYITLDKRANVKAAYKEHVSPEMSEEANYAYWEGHYAMMFDSIINLVGEDELHRRISMMRAKNATTRLTRNWESNGMYM